MSERPIQFTCTHCGYVASTEYGIGLRDQIATLTAELDAANREIAAQDEALHKAEAENARLREAHSECPVHTQQEMWIDVLEARTRDLEAERTLAAKARDNWREAHDQVQARNRVLAEALAMAKSMILSRERMSETAAATIQAALLGVAALTEPTPSASESEGMLLRRLSDLLTGGNAGTWDEILHAATALTEPERPTPPAGEPEPCYPWCGREPGHLGPCFSRVKKAEKSGRITMPHSDLSST